MIDVPLLTEELKRDEGFRSRVYKCSAGKQTIGYGFNLEDNDFPERIAEILLSETIGRSIADCERFDWFYDLSPVRKRVIINMVYNIGFGGVSKFKKMIAAIKVKDWSEAAHQMQTSHWYNQVGYRAVRLVDMMLRDCVE